MAEAELSSIYSQEQNAVVTHRKGTKIRLQENLLSQHLKNRQWVEDRASKEWIEMIFKESAIYEGFDELLWGQFFVSIYKDPATNKFGSLIIDKLGVTHINPANISSGSRFFPAVENLDPKDRNSNVKKCIAVSLLEKFAQVTDSELRLIKPQGLKFDYDPTHAGDLASGCKLVEFGTPENVGRKLLSLGFLQQRYAHSSLFDVVYEQKPSTTDSNNRIVFNLGEQLEQLFDPLNEYSPEQTEYIYKPPEKDEGSVLDDSEVKSIMTELLQLQTTFTLSLVEFLQSFLISLRVQVLNNEIAGLSTVKLNRLFPPTIDEVTRINCIFLDSLKSATPYGSLEVLKACSLTIPYFYKAYTRHGAATKNFNKDIKLFLRRFSDKMPHKTVFTEMKIETIIKGPLEKLTKLKLIIDRLFKAKNWASENLLQAENYYKNVMETVESFGRLESQVSSYSTRVFTPSGKILTELAKGWPTELQYKWLRRRIVGVFDILEKSSPGKRMLLVIFSDYVVFLDINEADSYYKNDGQNKPQMADILMNSLINEVPLPPKIPKLTVANHCFIDDIFVSSLQDGTLRFDSLKEEGAFSVVCKLVSNSVSNSSVAELVVKAKILEKETAFHLFRASHDDITVYLTAHELEAYKNEIIKSKFAIFLNMEPSVDLIQQFNLQSAIFIKFTPNIQKELLQLDILTYDGRVRSTTVLPEMLISQLIEELKVEMPICYSSVSSPMVSKLLKTNDSLVKMISHSPRQLSSGGEETAILENRDNESFIPDHEKKKSFGTITTYRSNVSDLKDVSIVPRPTQGRKQEKNLQTSVPTTIISNKSTERKPQLRQPKQQLSSKKNTSNKRRSIVDVVFRLFGAKDRSASTAKSAMKRKVKKAPKDTKDRQSLGNTTPALKVENDMQEKEINSSRRVASVIRKPNNLSIAYSTPNASFEPEKSQQNNFEEELSNEGSHPCPATSSNSSYTEMVPQASAHLRDMDPTTMDFTNTHSKPPSDGGFYKQTARQSQLFDDDLFGDLIVKSSMPATSGMENAVDDHARDLAEKAQRASGTSDKKNTLKIDVQGEYPCKEPSQFMGNLSASVSNSPSESSNTLDVKSNKEAGTPIKTFKKKEGTEDIDEESSASEFKDRTTEQNRNTIRQKDQIFPSIPVIEPPKISFERSSSFIELFEGMRLILDESDAQYNWKSLSNDAPAIKSHPVHGEDYVPHAFKSIALAADSDPLTNASESQPHQKTTGSQAGGNEFPAVSSTTDFVPMVPEKNSPVDLLDEISLKENALDGPVNKAIPAFKVVKASPTRIVKRASQQIESEGTEQSLRCTFSISSDLNRITDKRWFELKLTSQEDLQADAFYTPVEEPTPKFVENQGGDSEVSSALGSSDKAGEMLQGSTTSGSNEQNDKDSVLDDIDFSSFHVTFDTVESKPESSPDTSSYSERDEAHHSINSGPPAVDRTKQGPLIYRLPVYPSNGKSSSSVSNLSRSLGLPEIGNEDDDPIWVSPSKLEFYDLSKVAEIASFPKHSETVGNGEGGSELTVKTQRIDDKNSLRELSYAYLASLVSPTESHFSDDKPVRLQFKE